MPEGDTIVRAARRVEAAVGGKALRRLECRGRSLAAPGARSVVTVAAHGKHLLVRLEDGTALRTHLQMHGRWDTYAPGRPWWRAAFRARAVLEAVDGWTAVCFDAPQVELLRGAAEERARLGHLGTDLCRADADLGGVVRRLDRIAPDTELGVALLDQRVAAGIGNVFKSEICFACHVNPFRAVASLSPDERRAIVEQAASLLRANVGPGRRVTWNGGYAVYRRARRPCPRCGTAVRFAKQGTQGRGTYWCPACQPAPS
ncbi:MAG: DNA-formamidopyrimidine glycosylase family protein [Acidimicrobiia bacterium]